MFRLFAISFFITIACYWILRVMKNALFMDIVNVEQLPYAKLVSVGTLIGLLIIYNFMIGHLGRLWFIQTLFSFYALMFFVLTLLLVNFHFASEHSRMAEIFGWVFYVTIESFGTLCITLLWSYTVNMTSEECAKTTFPLYAVYGNIGSLAGAGLVSWGAMRLGIVPLLFIVSALIFSVPVLFAIFDLSKSHLSANHGHSSTKISSGILEGLHLIMKRPYLLSIVAMVIGYEMTGTFFEYQMNAAAKETLVTLERVTSFLGLYGVITSSLSVVFALFGTSFLIRKLGLVKCLVAFPVLLAVLNLFIQAVPGLWTFFLAQVSLKGINFAMNKPCVEMLYIPTSRTIQLKAKSWIDSVGNRGGKALGSLVNASIPFASLLHVGGLVILGVLMVWIPIAWYVGRKNEDFVEAETALA